MLTWVLLAVQRLPITTSMTTEFELPCVDCGQELVRQRLSTGGDDVTVAQCPDCGSRYYPEDALGRI